MDPVSCDFFVATDGAQLVRIEEATNQITTIDLAYQVTGLAIDPSTDRLYALHEAADAVTILDVETGDTTFVAVGSQPVAVTVDALRGRAYILNRSDSTISVLEGGVVSNTLKCKGEPVAAAIDPATGHGFAALGDADMLFAFDAAGIDTSYYATGQDPIAVEIDPERGEVYIANSGEAALTVLRVDPDSLFSVVLSGPAASLALNPETGRLFVGLATSSVDIVATDTYVAQNVGLPSAPDYVAVDPLSDRGFASMPGTGLIAEIGASGDTLLISPGGTPGDLLVNPITNKCYVCNPTGGRVGVLEAADYTGQIIAAGYGPGQMVLNFETHEVFTPNWFSDEVTVVDGYTNATSSIPTAHRPNGLKIDPVADDLYVVCPYDDKVTLKRSGSPDTLLVPIGRYAHGLGLNLNTGMAYVANRYSRDLTVFDMQTLDTTLVRTGAYPCFVGINMETNTIYVPNRTSWTLTVVDGALLTTDFARIGPGPTQVHVDPVRNKAIAVDTNQRTLSVIDGITLERVVVPVGTTPRSLDMNLNTGKYYVSSGIDGEITVVDADTHRRTPVPCKEGLFGVKVDPWLDKAYTVNWNDASIHVIDGSFCTSMRIPVEDEPHGSAYDPVLEKLYVSNHARNTISVMNLRDKIAPRIEVTIDTLAGDVAYTRTPTLTGTATSLRTPRNYGIMKVLYKIDNLRGPWSEATLIGSGASVSWQLTTPELLIGNHELFVVAIDSTAGSLSSSSSSSLLRTSDITAYEFTCLTPAPEPPQLAGSEAQDGTDLLAWSQTCGKDGWYNLELSLDADFLSEVTAVTGIRAASYDLAAHTVQTGTYYWRVSAVDYPHGKQSAFSEIFTLSLSDLGDDTGDPATGSLVLSVYPNPSSQRVALKLLGRCAGRAHCSIYDVGGRLVTTMPMAATDGGLTAIWEATDSRGSTVPPGVYYARIEIGGLALKHKIILLR
jgi:DNA-binding beta-propeller fold protein YncE